VKLLRALIVSTQLHDQQWCITSKCNVQLVTWHEKDECFSSEVELRKFEETVSCSLKTRFVSTTPPKNKTSQKKQGFQELNVAELRNRDGPKRNLAVKNLAQTVLFHDILDQRFPTFSDHVPFQHFDRW